MSLIIIEGLDGSGKGTQTELLYQALSKNYAVRRISFPDYSQPSSALVKMYLNGEFGQDPSDVNAYAASLFYAVDRFASFKKNWKEDYENNTIIIADRYVTSNLIYQSEKLPPEQRKEFFEWVQELEYGKLGLPKPDLVIYLDMDPDISQKLMSERYKGNEEKKDIHERNLGFIERCRICAKTAAEEYGWKWISCFHENEPLSIETIHQSVLAKVMEVI